MLLDCLLCDFGYYCVYYGNEKFINLCSVGFYCFGGDREVKFSVICCIFGYFCLEVLYNMIICIFGRYCDWDELDDMVGLCDFGYYCLVGFISSC